MKPVIHSVHCPNHSQFETWEPHDPGDVAEHLIVHIGAKGKKGTDIFSIQVATPKGLAMDPVRDGIIAQRALAVVDRYEYWSVYTWLQKIVDTCEGTTWADCANELRVYFHWEDEGLEAFYDTASGKSGNNPMKLVIHSVSCRNHPNIRTWEPDDPDDFVEELTLKIGPKGQKQADAFTIRVATPTGLARLPAVDGIIAMRPLVVMDRYDFELLWAWLQQTVETCETETWLSCVSELRVYFAWEHERVKLLSFSAEDERVT
jgi:hypothetical protein